MKHVVICWLVVATISCAISSTGLALILDGIITAAAVILMTGHRSPRERMIWQRRQARNREFSRLRDTQQIQNRDFHTRMDGLTAEQHAARRAFLSGPPTYISAMGNRVALPSAGSRSLRNGELLVARPERRPSASLSGTGQLTARTTQAPRKACTEGGPCTFADRQIITDRLGNRVASRCTRCQRKRYWKPYLDNGGHF